jgi:hypothetical protein
MISFNLVCVYQYLLMYDSSLSKGGSVAYMSPEIALKQPGATIDLDYDKGIRLRSARFVCNHTN